MYRIAVEVIWSDEALKHLARSQRYPGAVDIEVEWTAEATTDVDAVQVDPYWTSRIKALAIIGYSPELAPCSSCSSTATWTAICTA